MSKREQGSTIKHAWYARKNFILDILIQNIVRMSARRFYIWPRKEREIPVKFSGVGSFSGFQSLILG
jgi:hypothetical protein